MKQDPQIWYWAHMLDEAMGVNDFPDFLYHAPPVENVCKIEQHGVRPGGNVQWKNLSRENVTYWANTPLLAALYVRMKGFKRDQIAIYKASIQAFDTAKLGPDRNYSSDVKSGAFEYKGGISAKNLERVDF